MKHVTLIVGAVAVICILSILFFSLEKKTEPIEIVEDDEQLTNKQVETPYGFSFGYAAGKDGYTVVIPEDAVSKDLVFTQSVFSTMALENVVQNSEYPPALVMEVYRNPMNLDIEEWIRTNERSYFSLSTDGSLQKKKLGSTEYSFYTHDGLYRTDAYAYAQEGFVYLFSNMWDDAQSPQKKDMEEVLASVTWSVPAITAQVAHGDISVSTPAFKEAIESPLTIKGMARGTWFFEASFPITLVDWDGKIIAQGVAQAQSDWMTENMVPWTAQIVFTKPDFDERGYLILQKDNPSGLPEHDDSIEIPILFK